MSGILLISNKSINLTTTLLQIVAILRNMTPQSHRICLTLKSTATHALIHKILDRENPHPRIYSPLSCVTSRSKVSVLSSVPDCSLGISQSFKGKQHILFPQHSYRNGHRLRKLDSKAVQWHVITYNYKRNVFFLCSSPTCVLICMNERERKLCSAKAVS